MSKKLFRSAALLSLALGRAAAHHAMTPPSMSVNVMPRASVSGLGTPSDEGFGAGVTVWHSVRDSLRRGGRAVDNPNKERTETLRTTLSLDHRLGRRLSLAALFPYIRSRASYAGAIQRTNGPGDASLFVKYALYQDRLVRPTRELQALAGAELATGDTKAVDAQGKPLPITQQLGSHSTDAVLGGAWTWGLPRLSLYGDATYRFNGGAAYRFGDALSVNAGANLPVPRDGRFSLTAELNGEFWGRDRSSLTGPGVGPDKRVRDSGGETLYATPGLQWRPAPGWSLSLAVQLPLYQNYRGAQLASEANPHLSVAARLGGGNSL